MLMAIDVGNTNMGVRPIGGEGTRGEFSPDDRRQPDLG